MTWTHEDGGPRRRQTTDGRLDVEGAALEVTVHPAPVTTMAVAGDGQLLLLRHEPGHGAPCSVERLDPRSLDVLGQSAALAGGPLWPGGLGLAADGSVHVVFGNHAHRLDADLQTVASRTLPLDKPYNSFVALADGHLVTKDFGGSLPNLPVIAAADRERCELLVLDPQSLDVVASLVLPEPSIARLSADGDDIYVVGDTSLLRVRWDGTELTLDRDFTATYRTLDGQTYGWDCVLAAGAAWFLDDGDGAEGYDGTLRGHGLSTAPLHLVRVDLTSAEVAMVEICGRPGGLVANPPVVDEGRGVVVGYDSGNGQVTAFDLATLEVRWRREQDHASHLILYEGSGELVTGDGADVVVLDIATGVELARAESGHGIQSVLFPTPGFDRDFYVCTFLGISRVAVAT